MTSTGDSNSNGLMQRISDLSWNAVKSDGTIANAISGSTQQSQDLQDSDRRDDRDAAQRERR